MSEQLPPDWAIERACERSGHPDGHWAWAKIQPAQNPTIIAFARYISEHEEPPVDSIEEALGEVLKGFCPNDLRVYGDRSNAVRILRKSLSRAGIEIGKEMKK